MRKFINGFVWACLTVVVSVCVIQLLQGISYANLGLHVGSAINTIAFYLASNYSLYGLPVGVVAGGVFSLPVFVAFWVGYKIAAKPHS